MNQAIQSTSHHETLYDEYVQLRVDDATEATEDVFELSARGSRIVDLQSELGNDEVVRLELIVEQRLDDIL